MQADGSYYDGGWRYGLLHGSGICADALVNSRNELPAPWHTGQGVGSLFSLFTLGTPFCP